MKLTQVSASLTVAIILLYPFRATISTEKFPTCHLPPQVWAAHGALVNQTVIDCLGDGYPLFMQAMQQVADAEQARDYPQMEVSLRTLIQMAPNFAHAWWMLGNALQEQGRLNEAIPAWQQALQLNPQIDHAYYQLGIAMELEEKIEEAICYE